MIKEVVLANKTRKYLHFKFFHQQVKIETYLEFFSIKTKITKLS